MDKNIRFAVVEAKKDNTGAFVAPNANTINKDDLNAIATDDKPATVTPKGYPGQTYVAGSLYLGNFDVEANRFVSDLVPAPAIKLSGNLNPTNIKTNNGSFTEDNK